MKKLIKYAKYSFLIEKKVFENLIYLLDYKNSWIKTTNKDKLIDEIKGSIFTVEP